MAGLDARNSCVALTAGDPNGVGPEIALKALAALTPEQRNRVTLFGPVEVLQKTAHLLQNCILCIGTANSIHHLYPLHFLGLCGQLNCLPDRMLGMCNRHVHGYA